MRYTSYQFSISNKHNTFTAEHLAKLTLMAPLQPAADMFNERKKAIILSLNEQHIFTTLRDVHMNMADKEYVGNLISGVNTRMKRLLKNYKPQHVEINTEDAPMATPSNVQRPDNAETSDTEGVDQTPASPPAPQNSPPASPPIEEIDITMEQEPQAGPSTVHPDTSQDPPAERTPDNIPGPSSSDANFGDPMPDHTTPSNRITAEQLKAALGSYHVDDDTEKCLKPMEFVKPSINYDKSKWTLKGKKELANKVRAETVNVFLPPPPNPADCSSDDDENDVLPMSSDEDEVTALVAPHHPRPTTRPSTRSATRHNLVITDQTEIDDLLADDPDDVVHDVDDEDE